MNNKLRSTKQYREWRTAVFERDGFTCQECGSKVKLEAHHIKEICNYPNLVYEIDNGITLCHNCHTLTDSYLFFDKPTRVKNNNQIKKSVTMSKDVADILSQIAKKLEITENSVISVALLEYYNKIKSSL